MIEKITNIIDKFKRMETKELETYKIITIFLIIINLFGIWHYLKLKTLGGAILLILIGFLALILFLEKNSKGGAKMDIMGDEEPEEETKPEEKKKEKKEEEDSDIEDFKFGMPTPESCAEALK